MLEVATLRNAVSAVAWLIACAPAHAQTCESIQAKIDASIRSNGVTNFTLTVVDADAANAADGKVVGTCGLGSKKIIYAQGGSPDRGGASPVRPTIKNREAILTECKDGTVTYGDCP